MFYTVYKITNLINGKFYIGKHQTENIHDSYMGSGRIIKQAIKKYGKENFKKEIIACLSSKQEMNAFEFKYITEELIHSAQCYNLCTGGNGGNLIDRRNKTYKEIYGERADEIANKISLSKRGMLNPFFGKKHSEEARVKISKASKSRSFDWDEHARRMKTRADRAAAGTIVYGMKNKKHSEETKAKQSAALKEYHRKRKEGIIQ